MLVVSFQSRLNVKTPDEDEIPSPSSINTCNITLKGLNCCLPHFTGKTFGFCYHFSSTTNSSREKATQQHVKAKFSIWYLNAQCCLLRFSVKCMAKNKKPSVCWIKLHFKCTLGCESQRVSNCTENILLPFFD